MMQLDVYLDAGHRALGKWKRGSCKLNSELVSLLDWPRFVYDAGCGQPQRATLLLSSKHQNSSTPLAIATLAYQSSYRIAVIRDLYECS